MSDLFTIDSVKMLSRAYIIGGGKSASKSFQFDDETYKTFWLDGSRYLAVKNLSELYDTLQYSDLVMKIYTDEKSYDSYHNKKSKVKIEVLGIQMGNKSYIALDDINREERKGRISLLIFFSIAYLIFLAIHLMRVLKNKSIQEKVL